MDHGSGEDPAYIHSPWKAIFIFEDSCTLMKSFYNCNIDPESIVCLLIFPLKDLVIMQQEARTEILVFIKFSQKKL